MAGRENKDITGKVSAQKMIQKINKPWAQYLAQNKITAELQKQVKSGNIVIIMGAGNIYNTGQQLIKELSTGKSLTKKE